MLSAKDIIEKLSLVPLEGEGGFFKQTFKDSLLVSSNELKSAANNRAASTAIYYLITQNNFSAFHRLPQAEVLHFYLGSPVEMVQITSAGTVKRLILGPQITKNQHLQVVVPQNTWQASCLVEGGEWAILGATVSPGFEFEDMEVASRLKLIALYPNLKDTINRFTRS